MINYGWMRQEQAPQATEAAKAAFRLARADQADQAAKYWEGRGDDVQAERFRATAEALRA